MTQKGQIVEIPATASVFAAAAYASKEEELRQKAMPKNYSLFDGFLVGEHQGTSAFRLGQRKGLQLGGKKEPVYVIGIDEGNNRIFVGQGSQHPGLWGHVFRFGNTGQWEDVEKGGHVTAGGIIPVDIMTGLDNSLLPAKLYVFHGSVFLESDTLLPISVLDYPIKVRLKNDSLKWIQIN